jgi:hypothetical protein
MTVKAPSHDVLAKMARDVDQLVDPIHVAIRGRIVTHLPLLDQLRRAAVPGNSVRGQERRPIPQSKPPLRLDTVERLQRIYLGISVVRLHLNLPVPPAGQDGAKAMLRAFVAEAPSLAPSIAEQWLAVEVNGWWRDAAVGSGWAPADLLKLR